MIEYKFHPLCLAFPDYTPQVYSLRRDDYKAHPERAGDTAVLIAQDPADGEWKIADGRHHYRICRELGYECDFQRFTGPPAELSDLVLSRNAHRRHVEPSQIAAAIVAVSDWVRGGDHGNQHTGGKTARAVLPTQAETAKAAGVSTDTLQRAAKVKEKAPDVLPALRDGKLDAKTAAKVADLPKPDREKIVAAVNPKAEAKRLLKSGSITISIPAAATTLPDSEVAKRLDAIGNKMSSHSGGVKDLSTKISQLLIQKKGLVGRLPEDDESVVEIKRIQSARANVVAVVKLFDALIRDLGGEVPA